MYESAQNINIISMNQEQICTIKFQAILVYLKPHNSTIQSKLEEQWR
jgi:hypothetical protein